MKTVEFSPIAGVEVYDLRGRMRLMNLWDMLNRYARHFLTIQNKLQNFSVHPIIRSKSDDPVTQDYLNQIEKLLVDEVIPILEEIDLPLTIKDCQDTIDQIHSSSIYRNISEQLNRINSNLMAELKNRQFLYVKPDRASFYNDPFPKNLIALFPDSVFDIEQAFQCYALGRDVACIFHLMRAVDGVLDELAKTHGHKHSPTWDAHILEFERHANNLRPVKPKNAQINKEISYFSALANWVKNIRDAWRNESIHVVQKKYSPDETFEILTAMKAFFRTACNKA